jgi:AcrR family transcriptional regulator
MTDSQGMRAAARSRRQRNARGQGARLTEDIVSAAIALIERTGTDEAVTLRAVAREVGIAAPSIYAHFADRDAIVMAVIGRVFDELITAIEAGLNSAGPDPVNRLLAGCTAYVTFGLANPAKYAVLFSERRISAAMAAENYPPPTEFSPDGQPVSGLGAEAFGLLVAAIKACVDSGASASTDVTSAGTAVWVALHGAVSLQTTLPLYPWPEPAQFVRQLVLPLAMISQPAR